MLQSAGVMRTAAVGLRAGTDGAPYRHSVVRTPPVDMRRVSRDESADARVWATVSGDLVVESAWARCRCCHRSVSAGRSLNPPCVFPRNGLFTVSSVRWGAPPSRDWGLCCPCSGKRLMRTEARLYSSIPSAVGAGVVSTDVAPISSGAVSETNESPCATRSFPGSPWCV